MHSVRHRSQRSEVRCPVRHLTFVSPSADSGRASGENMFTIIVLVNCFGGLSLSINSVVTLTDRPHITMDEKQQSSNNQAQCWKTSCQC